MPTLRAELLIAASLFLVAGPAAAQVPPIPAPPAESDQAVPPAAQGPVGATTAPCECESCRANRCDRCGRSDCGNRGFLSRLFHLHRHHDDYCRAYPPPPPFGSTATAILDTQRDKGVAARMVLYHYDFEADGAALTPRGKRQVHKIAQWLPANTHPIIIEPSRDDEELDQARRKSVLAELGKQPFPVPDVRVVVAMPPSRGLDGIDAEKVHANMMRLWITTSSTSSTPNAGTSSAGTAAARNGNGY